MNALKPQRVTIAAVARRAGVSPSAVSHVFNGRTNVSEATAQRIRRAADDLNWRPNFASRKISGGASSLGLVIARDSGTFGRDPFFMRLLAGLTEPLTAISWSLSLTVVPSQDEERIYRDWWGERRVDAFLLVDVRSDDPRVGLMDSLGAPAVVLGESGGEKLPAVSVGDDEAFARALEHLGELGHRHVVRVDEAPGFVRSSVRDDRFRRAGEEAGIATAVVPWDGDAEDPVASLLSRLDGATAVILDSESTAAEVLSRAPEVGMAVPEQLSVMAWEDSWISQLTRPRLTAFNAPVEESARAAVDLVSRLAQGEDVSSISVAGRQLVVRDSTGPASRPSR